MSVKNDKQLPAASGWLLAISAAQIVEPTLSLKLKKQRPATAKERGTHFLVRDDALPGWGQIDSRKIFPDVSLQSDPMPLCKP